MKTANANKPTAPTVFVTIPSIAESAAIHPQKCARELGLRGINPDGLIRNGSRVIPLFSEGRLPAINSALSPESP